jgi:SAM-dependent methyltransferase
MPSSTSRASAVTDDETISVQRHYDDHLGPIYTWMIGDFDRAKEAARQELQPANLDRGAGPTAVDLGSGPGVHAMVLAEAGYAVTAIDTCAPLVDELQARAGSLAIRCVHDDVLRLRQHCRSPIDLATCMGDTLTHLPSPAAVEDLFETIADLLKPGGMFMATFRDYSGPAPEGVRRIIPVRQDDRRILTCVLEYHDTTITVYDALHERTDTTWRFSVSGYSKLRLSPAWVLSALSRVGLLATADIVGRGMIRVCARRPR